MFLKTGTICYSQSTTLYCVLKFIIRVRLGHRGFIGDPPVVAVEANTRFLGRSKMLKKNPPKSRVNIITMSHTQCLPRAAITALEIQDAMKIKRPINMRTPSRVALDWPRVAGGTIIRSRPSKNPPSNPG